VILFLTDGLWTDKYAPCHANEVIGNWASCKRLRDWLAQWKQMIDRIETASQHTAAKRQRRSAKADGIFVTAVFMFSGHFANITSSARCGLLLQMSLVAWSYVQYISDLHKSD